jgi:hypothetical protein
VNEGCIYLLIYDWRFASNQSVLVPILLKFVTKRVKMDSNTITAAPLDVKDEGKGPQCLGVYFVYSVPTRYK